MAGTCPFRSMSVGFRAACAGGLGWPRLRAMPCSTARRQERLRAWTRSSRSPSFVSMRTGVETGTLARLVRPSRPIPAEATAVHGIGDEDVASALRFAEIAPELLEFTAGAVFVAHNARFDLAM